METAVSARIPWSGYGRARRHRRFRRGPILTEWRVAYFVEQVQILDRSVVDCRKAARMLVLPGPPKILPNAPSLKLGEYAIPRRGEKLFVVRWGECAWNSRISGNNPSKRCGWELCGLQTWHDRLNLALRVIPRHADFPAHAEVQRYIRFDLPGVFAISATITSA